MSHEHSESPLPFDPAALNGISRQVSEWHHDTHYAAHIKSRNAAEKRLAEMRDKGDFSDIRAVKKSESHNASGQVLHEIYFAVLGGDGKIGEDLAVHQRMVEDFGSFDCWLAEFKAVAAAARGWAVTCFDPSDGRLRIVLVDGNDHGVVWGARPILPIDVWEHAYYFDQGPNRAAYIEAFLANVNWKAVDELYREAAGV